MDARCTGYVLDPAKCRLLSINDKKELILEISKLPDASEKFQTWTRRDILDILCADLGKERKYTGLSKQRMLDYLFRIVNEKSPGDHAEERDSTPEPPSASLQSPSKRQRKSSNPSRLPVAEIDPVKAAVTAVSVMRCCQNVACRANLNPEDKFCRRCSCCICHNYDENKDPSLWLFCSADSSLQKGSCGLSCHLDCALNDERTGISKGSGEFERLDGSFFCVNCRKQNDLLGCWKKQLNIAKNARRLDVLCHRLYLSHKLLLFSERYRALHENVSTALRKLEAEVGPITGMPNMGRGIVSRLAVGTEVQRLCALALDSLESMLSSTSPAATRIQRFKLEPSNFIRIDDLSQTSLAIVLDLENNAVISQEISSFSLWCQKAGGEYPSDPINAIVSPNNRALVTDLVPATAYMFKVVAYRNKEELGSVEVRVKTRGSSEDDSNGSVQGNAGPELQDGSMKTSSGGVLSNLSSSGVESNNNVTIYADLNKSPESEFEFFENPPVLELEKASQSPVKSEDQNEVMPSRSECIGAGNMPESDANATVLAESSNTVEVNQTTDMLSKENVSNAHAGADMMIIRYGFPVSSSPSPVVPVWKENSKGSGGSGWVPKAKLFENMSQMPPPRLDRERGSSSDSALGRLNEAGHKDGCPEASYEYCVKVVRWLETEGFIETNFRVKFLTWFSLRATPQERRVVSVYVDTLIDDPVSLAGQLSDTFSEAIYSRRPPSMLSGFCVELWH